MAKYNNRKITLHARNGEELTFDSKREATRWQELELLQLAGRITDLRRQVKFELIPAQRDENKKAIRAVNYIADFVYTDAAGRQIVEDSKGFRTKEFIIKSKLMLQRYGITVREI